MITGLYKKPSLSAMRGPVVMSGENMTLSCTSDHQFDMFHLSREGVPQGHGLPAEQSHRGTFQANFLLVTMIQSGTYRCYGSFRNSSHVWSSPSAPLFISVTGSHDKPSLSAWPSPVVPNGQHVEIRCDSNKYNTFRLYKEHGEPKPQIHDKIFQKSLLLGPVTRAYAGTYRCYDYNCQCPSELSSHSDPLEIIISGIYMKPFLLVLSTPLVKSGEKMTLECLSEIMFDTFILTSHRKQMINSSFHLPAESHHGGSHASFSIGPVTPDHAGVYTCYGSYNQTPYEWSESSDPVDIMITGLYKKPSLSAMRGPVVMSGENMTLSCTSDHQFDMFHLFREGVPQGHGLPAEQSHSGTFQANFLLVTMIQSGTYRCYGFFRNSSHVWSSPSDPLYISVTGKKVLNCTSCIEPDSKTNNHRNKHILVGLSATMILVFLIILLYSYYFVKNSKSQEQASESTVDQESEVRPTLNRQDIERQEVQEVTYLDLDHIFKQKLTTSISQIPKEFSTDPSVYMEVRKC
ncbi:killer cell immunoglobulin-like receptor 3DL1 [Chionomys nivalis]|uniref:killer cell immunoglobulin-like receptor 3DL1 n=1 Tax=Chionomys nivalis TaxID=269649 RepID=UPI002597DC88|nr:killer cell immunoglobulin-like receptor 3DL1 [Chionomys nivalis]